MSQGNEITILGDEVNNCMRRLEKLELNLPDISIHRKISDTYSIMAWFYDHVHNNFKDEAHEKCHELQELMFLIKGYILGLERAMQSKSLRD
jgi:hypothetical protein